MKLDKLLKNNTFLINSAVCVVVLLCMCYLGMSSPIKKTYSASTCNGTQYVTEDGVVCVEDGDLYGDYKWNEYISMVSNSGYDVRLMGAPVYMNFTSNNVDYRLLWFQTTNTTVKIIYNETSMNVSNAKIQLSADTLKEENGKQYFLVELTGTGQEADKTLSFTSKASVDADFYNWFIENTSPVNKCYYNSSTKEFEWTNVSNNKILYNYIKTQESCESTDVNIDFDDYEVNNNYVILDYGTTLNDLKDNIIVTPDIYSINLPKKVATGEKIEILDSDAEVYDTYTIVVLGDVNGDGIISSQDYIEIYRHLSPKYADELDNEYLLSADYDGKNSVNSADYIEIYNYLREKNNND